MACTAFAAPARVSWDAQLPGVRYRVYLGIEVVADVATAAAVIDLPEDRISAVAVQAYSLLGTAPMSEPLTLEPLTTQSSETLTHGWMDHGTVFRAVMPGEKRRFFRIRYPLEKR